MALIVGFPDFSATPNAADLNLAAAKIAEQIGGVLPDGTAYQGNLDLNNLSAAPRFRNEQKREPYSEFSLQVGWLDALPGATVALAAPLPFDSVLEGVAFQQFKKHVGFVTTTLGGRKNAGAFTPIDFSIFKLPDDDLAADWKVGGLIPAGVPLGAYVTFSPAATDPWYVTFFLKALHRR